MIGRRGLRVARSSPRFGTLDMPNIGVAYMMTQQPAALVPWGTLDRTTKHRTSAPTDRALRAAVAGIAARGPRPTADAVLLAALRLVDAEALRAEVRKVEGESHDPRQNIDQ